MEHPDQAPALTPTIRTPQCVCVCVDIAWGTKIQNLTTPPKKLFCFQFII